MFGLRTPIPLLAAAILLVVPAEATTSYYVGATNEASFNSTVTSLQLLNPTLTFSSGDLGSGGLFNANGTGINFLGFDTDFAFNSPADFSVNSGKLTATLSGEVVKITFPVAGVYAVGFHITMTAGTNVNWCISSAAIGCDNTVLNASTSVGDVQFFGFVSDSAANAPLYIKPQSGSPFVVFTDFEAYSVPEPQTMLLVGIGLAILGLARRKRPSKV
jgi:hypothetical protein